MIKKILKALVLLFVLIQFYRPVKNISTVTPITDFLLSSKADDLTSGLFKNTCYDCHSNNTKYPWYNNIAPVSWILADHVDEGKEELNFSEWTTFSDKRKNHKLEEIVEMLEEGEMPLKGYLIMHSEAKLSKGDVDKMIRFVKEL